MDPTYTPPPAPAKLPPLRQRPKCPEAAHGDNMGTNARGEVCLVCRACGNDFLVAQRELETPGPNVAMVEQLEAWALALEEALRIGEALAVAEKTIVSMREVAADLARDADA
jgi:hypothetical protein